MRSHKSSHIAGYSLVLTGLAVNGWTLSPLASDGRVSLWQGILLLFLFQLPAILSGAIVLLCAGRKSLPGWLDLILLATSIAFVLALSEMLLNQFVSSPLFQPAPRAFVGEFENRDSKHFVADPATGWRMKSITEFRWRIDDHWNHYRSNSQGFRSEIDFDRIEAPGRIFVSGDSFAFGTGVDVEESFPALLEERLGGNSAVCNLAMPGFGLDQMWMSVRHQALPMNPALVVVAFIDDDLDRSLTAYRRREGFNKPIFELDGAALRPQRAGDRPHIVTRFLERNSALWAAGQSLVRAIGFYLPIGDWWSRNEAIFNAILADCRSSGVPVLFVRLPSKDWKEFPNLKRLAERNRAALLDLGSPGIRPSHDLHFRNDGHINEAGHAFVAEKVSAWIAEHLPPEAARHD